MFFSDSTLTRKEGELTSLFPTLLFIIFPISELLPDVSLSDEDTGVVDWLSKRAAEYAGLKSSLEELVHGKSEDVIELSFWLTEESVPGHAAHKGGSLE